MGNHRTLTSFPANINVISTYHDPRLVGTGHLHRLRTSVGSLFYRNFKLSTRLANRNVQIEAHKQLFETNRQQIADPRLWAIWDVHQVQFKEDLADPVFRLKLRSFAYMQLNIFEMVMVQLPNDGPVFGTWQRFFTDSLEGCSLLRELLIENEERGFYHPVLIALWKDYERTRLLQKSEAAPNQP